MTTSLQTHEARRRKQIRILATLLVVLLAIVFSPVIQLGIQELLPRRPISLANVEIPIPKKWMVSRTPSRITAWKPCSTVFCASSSRTGFTIEATEIAGSQGIWENAAQKILRSDYAAAPMSKVDLVPGKLTCVEVDPTPNDKAVSFCINSDLGFTSSFYGDRSLKPSFYGVLASARKTS